MKNGVVNVGHFSGNITGIGTAYTVPAGRYAKISFISISLSAAVSIYIGDLLLRVAYYYPSFTTTISDNVSLFDDGLFLFFGFLINFGSDLDLILYLGP